MGTTNASRRIIRLAGQGQHVMCHVYISPSKMQRIVRVRAPKGHRTFTFCGAEMDLRYVEIAASRMIEVNRLSKLYDKFTAVRDLSFSVAPGEVLGLVGANGAGKTSTLRCLAGIIPPTLGTVSIGGHDIVGDPVAAKGHLAFLADEPRLFDYLTVAQHLAFTARIYRVANYQAVVQPLLEELEMADKVDLLPGELSRGMKQKLVIACGLLHSPSAILFDEPLTGLDPLGIRQMKATIRKRAADGAAVIISSHLLPLLEEICSHVLILSKGTKIVDGTMAEVVNRFSSGAGGTVDLEEVFFRVTQPEAAERSQP